MNRRTATPTPEQIREGRDEALEHLGITPDQWASMEHQRTWLKEQAHLSDLHAAAAVTIAQAEQATTEGMARFNWAMTSISISLIAVDNLTRADFALQA